MSLSSHLEQLEKKHAALDAELQRLQRFPSTSNTELSALKRKKLALKDQIERKRNLTTVHSDIGRTIVDSSTDSSDIGLCMGRMPQTAIAAE